eukprot:NODE_66_length_25735_cov_0.318497.p16 type:complete len:245 gc:universal NODE_66_length_25735_cov_0.318497:12786-13520(+)
MLSRSLFARNRIDQNYSKLVWSRKKDIDPKENRMKSDISVLNFVPSQFASDFLVEGSLVKSYLIKRELEFPKLKRFHKAFVPPTGHLKFECTTNLFDMTHGENQRCILRFEVKRVTKDEKLQKIVQVLAHCRLLYKGGKFDTIKIVGTRFPYYKQNMRWCVDKYHELIQTAKDILNSNDCDAFLETSLVADPKIMFREQKANAKLFPESWLIPLESSMKESLGKTNDQAEDQAKKSIDDKNNNS